MPSNRCPSEFHAGSTRVLLAEDSPTQQRLNRFLLEEAGAEVVVVSNGLYAVEAALHDTFDLVLMDLHMPEMGGVEATRAIRLHYNRATLPIVALTSQDEMQTKGMCQRAGMDDYLIKPLQLDAIRRLLQRTGCRSASMPLSAEAWL